MRRRVVVLFMLGTFLMQTAWILAVPPFRGADEFDHAYRADAVSRGEWFAQGTAEHGRGGLVTVPADIVSAAHAQCSALKYTGHDNCNAAAVLPDGQVRVASAASRYHPVFYWVVGTAARPFHGDAALYAMRAAAALLCALGLAVAAWSVSRTKSRPWSRAGLLLAVTPVFAYSTVLPAPNGLEMVAGLVLWCTLLALDEHRRPGDGWLISWAVVASLCLVTLRSLGPLFAVLIVISVLLTRRGRLRSICSAHASGLALAVGLTALATVASVWWIVAQAPLGAPGVDFTSASYLDSWQALPVGVFQTIAAFPLRQEEAPIFVYIVYLAMVATFFVVALRKGRGSRRQGLVVGLILSQLIPLTVTVVSIKSVGLVWQGRYGLPFVAGLTVLAGVVLDQARTRDSPRPVLAAAAAAYVVVQSACIGGVYHRELGNPASTLDAGFLQTHTSVVVVIGAIGWLIMVASLLVGSGRGDGDRMFTEKDSDPPVAPAGPSAQSVSD